MAEIGFPRQDTRAALEHGNMVLTDACNAMVSAAQSLLALQSRVAADTDGDDGAAQPHI